MHLCLMRAMRATVICIGALTSSQVALAGGANNPPILIAGPAATPLNPYQGTPVTFSVAAVDPDGDALTFDWHFDDGLHATGPVVLHRFGAISTFIVTVTVSDGNGGTVVDSVSVAVDDYPIMDADIVPPRVPANWTTGPKSVLVMLVDFPNAAAIATVQQATNIMNQAALYFAENSYGLMTISSTVTPVLHLPTTAADYPIDPLDPAVGRDSLRRLHLDARNAARAAGFDVDAFDLDLTWEPNVTGGNSAANANRGSNIETPFVGTIEHEIGHNLGLRHADQWRPTTTNPLGPGTDINYGNMFDAMGAAPVYPGSHFTTYAKHRLQWLPDSAIIDVTSSGVYRIHAFDQPNLNPAQFNALRINKDIRDYWVSFRQAIPSNPWLMNGVEVCWSPFGGTGGRPELIDTTPETFNSGSEPDTSDCPLTIGRTLADNVAGIFITPIGKGGTSPESMDVVVNIGNFAGNSPPTLTSINPSQTAVSPGATVLFSASASDVNNDVLAYHWDWGDGVFASVNSPNASHTFAVAGEYRVRCTATDMKGGTASKSAIITVGSPGTFRISGQVLRSGQPLADVKVFSSASVFAMTDSDGAYTIVNIPAGNYSISANKFDHGFSPSGFSNPVVVGPSNATGKSFNAILNNTAAPVVDSIPDQFTVEDITTTKFSFTVSDAQTPAVNLMITQSSSNPVLVPPKNVAIGTQGGDRTVTVLPEPEQFGTATITLSVSDGTHATTTSFDVTVLAVNDAPLAAADEYTTVGPLVVTSSGVLTNDSDVEGDFFSAALAAGPIHGVVDLHADGSFTYMPDPLFVGADAFAYTAEDADSSLPTQVSIDVPFARLDLNMDSVVDILDAVIFGDALLDPAANPSLISRADLTGDGLLDGMDIQPFVGAILSAGP